MKCNKKTCFLICAIVVAASVAIGIYFISTKNERICKTLTDEFVSIISASDNAKILETKSAHGKLNGNGNGTQYFGAVLAEKNSINNLDGLIAELSYKFEIVEWCEQTSKQIDSKYLEHFNLEYDINIPNECDYITIYFFNSSHPDSSVFDLSGH